MWVFAYGSLMNPDSLCHTLPGIDLREVVPARVTGFARGFDIAFPNDGSQTDKAYLDERGARPPIVSLCGIHPAERRWVNGVCLPADRAGLRALRERERRYDEREVGGVVHPYPGRPAPRGRVLTFVGKPEFTRAEHGLLPEAYLAAIRDGAAFWEQVAPGFRAEVEATTDLPPSGRIRPLRRIEGRR